MTLNFEFIVLGKNKEILHILYFVEKLCNCTVYVAILIFIYINMTGDIYSHEMKKNPVKNDDFYKRNLENTLNKNKISKN